MDQYESNLVSVYSTSVNNELHFWNDDSGMQMQPRKFGEYYPTLAANYYPSVATSFIVDNNANDQLVFLSERSHGVSSKLNGEFEMMLHRRMDTNGQNLFSIFFQSFLFFLFKTDFLLLDCANL